MKDRASKKCLNPWFKFLAILCVAVFTLFAIFEMDRNHISLNIHKISRIFQEEESAEYILIAASGSNLESSVAVQFETSPAFLVVEESSRGYSSFSNNPASYDINAMRDFISEQRIEAVIAGTMEIGTYQMLNDSRVEVFTGVTGTVEEAFRKYRKHELVSFSRYYKNRRQNASL